MCSYEDGHALLERVALSQMQYGQDRHASATTTPLPVKSVGIHQLAAIHMLTKQIMNLTGKAPATNEVCGICAGPHRDIECQENTLLVPDEQANYIQRPQNNPFSNTYNPGWRNHPRFSYANSQPIPHNAGPHVVQGQP